MPDHEGFMEKKGCVALTPVLSTLCLTLELSNNRAAHSGIRKNWRQRWFVLEGAKLTYFDGDDARGSIDIKQIVDVRKSTCSSSKGFELEVETPVRTWRFRAPSEAEMNAWIVALSGSQAAMHKTEPGLSKAHIREAGQVTSGPARSATLIAAVAVPPARTWGVITQDDHPNFPQPKGVWDKSMMMHQLRQAAAGNMYDNGDESEGKGGRLWQCPNAAWVNVWNNDIRRLSLRMAPNLLYLDVSNNDIRTLEEVNGGQNLVYLDAASNDIGRGGRLGLPVPSTVVMSCLEALNLANNDIGPHIPAGAMDWCPNVRAVSLNDNDIESFPDAPVWPHLQVLNLANNNLRVVPTLPNSPYVRQIYLDKNFLSDDQIPAVCRLIDCHPYLIRLKLGHNNFSPAGIQHICDYARARNPYLFYPSLPNLQAEFSAPVSTYGADASGGRAAPATECWVVHAEPVNGPPFVEAFVVTETADSGLPIASGTVIDGPTADTVGVPVAECAPVVTSTPVETGAK